MANVDSLFHLSTYTAKLHSQVKLLLEMLVRKCGLDAVKAVMPEEHMKLLTNIRKVGVLWTSVSFSYIILYNCEFVMLDNLILLNPQTKERKERKLASQLGEETKSLHSRASTSRYCCLADAYCNSWALGEKILLQN